MLLAPLCIALLLGLLAILLATASQDRWQEASQSASNLSGLLAYSLGDTLYPGTAPDETPSRVGPPARVPLADSLTLPVPVKPPYSENGRLGEAARRLDLMTVFALFDGLRLGASDSVALYRSDGALLARRPSDSRYFGTGSLPVGLLQDTLSTPDRIHCIVSLSQVDGVSRLYALTAVRGTSLVVSVGVALSTIERPLWPWFVAAGGGLAALAVGGTVGVVLLRHERRRRRLAERRAAERARALAAAAAAMARQRVISRGVPSSGVAGQPALRRAGKAPEKTPGATHVMLVDDEPLLREALSEGLGERGFVVHGVGAGHAALAALAADRRIDAVVTDQAMSDMLGSDLVERIKDLWPRMPVLILSGDVSMQDRVGEVGADLVLRKPITARDLAACITSLLPAPIPA